MLKPPAAPASGTGEPNLGAAVELPAPNWNVPLPALPELLAEPKAKPPVGVDGCEGCAAPKVKLGVDNAAGAAGVVVEEPNPVPEPKPPPEPNPLVAPVEELLLLEPPKPGPEPNPLPPAADEEALFVLPNPEPAPKVNVPEPPGVEEDAPAVPNPLEPAFALAGVLDDAPKVNDGVEGAAALLVLPKVFEVEPAPKVLLGVEFDEPKENPPDAGAEPEAGAAGVDGAPKLNGLSPPFTLGVLVGGALDELKLNGLAASAGLAALLEPKEKPPDEGAAAAGAGLAEDEPKLNAGLSAAGAVEPLEEPKPDEAGAAELEPKLKAGLSFFSSGLAVSVVVVDEPNENAGLPAAGAAEPKLLPPEGAGDDELPKLKAGLSAAGLSVDGAGVDDAEPNENAGFSAAGLSVEVAGAPKLNAGLSPAAGVEAAGVELPEPKLKGALASAGLSAAGAGEVEGVSKLNAGIGASVGLSAAGAAEELPNEKPPEALGASAGLSAAGAPKLNAGLGASAEFSATEVVEPKLKGALEPSVGFEASPLDPLKRLLTTGGPVSAGLMPKSSLGGGVEAPEVGLEPPKKLGTPPSAALGAVDSGAGVVVLVAGFEKKLLAGGLPAGVVEPVGVSDELLVPEAAPEREKKPVEGGGDLGAEVIGAGAESFLGVVSGLDASATIELFARGEEARGRDCRPLRRLPSELSWALRCWVVCDEEGTLRRELSCGSDGAAGVVLSLGSSFFASLPNIGIEKFLNDARGILAFSSSSIWGRSSSRAEKRPLPVPGLVARDEE